LSNDRLPDRAITAPTSETGTVARTLQLLVCFAEQTEWPLAALARRLALPRSTVHRLLNLARSEAFVDSDGSGVYRPGLALYRMAGRLAVEMPLRRIAQPLLDGFTRTYAESSLLTVLDRPALKMFFAAKADAPAQMRYVIAMNTLGTLAWGASGRSLLAFLTEAEIEAVIARGEPAPADGRPLDPRELRISLAEVRANGHAITHQQRTTEGVGMAAPFFDAAGEVAGNLAVTIPAFRFNRESVPEMVRSLTGMAGQVSAALGSTASQPAVRSTTVSRPPRPRNVMAGRR
jgi:DNA-binding IclR family transcriptional regulator